MKQIFVFILLVVMIGCQTSQPKKGNAEVSYPPKENTSVQPPPAKVEAQPDDKVNQAVKKTEEKRKEEEKKVVISAKEEKKVTEPSVKEVPVEKKPEIPPADTAKVATPPPAPTPTPVPKVEEPKKVETPAEPAKKYFYLRIISYRYHDYYKKRAEDIVKYLKSQGIEGAEARVSSDSKGEKYWVVDIGKYDTPNAPKAKELKDKICDMKYEGSLSFKDAYYIDR